MGTANAAGGAGGGMSPWVQQLMGNAGSMPASGIGPSMPGTGLMSLFGPYSAQPGGGAAPMGVGAGGLAQMFAMQKLKGMMQPKPPDVAPVASQQAPTPKVPDSWGATQTPQTAGMALPWLQRASDAQFKGF